MVWRLSVRPSVCPSVSTKKHRCNWQIFYMPLWKTDILCRGNVCPSVHPSVRPRFPDFSSTCFEISIWNLVYEQLSPNGYHPKFKSDPPHSSRKCTDEYQKYRHSMNNAFGENELWKVSQASLWRLSGVIKAIDDLILTASVVQRPSFIKCIHKQKKLLFVSPVSMPTSKSICDTIYVSNYRKCFGHHSRQYVIFQNTQM